ncbi:MAG: glycoside hydrolase family 16 protein [Bacilli bacterium]|nr:glycoside hydrolase family 16 protein [Bacilli bacterium]
MKLIKHFDFKNETKLNLDEWNIRVGDKWANNELQHYVDDQENLYFDNGLVINATYEDNVYRSSRIDTKGKFFMKYGKIEARLKFPKGIGTWPAFWMLSEDNLFGHWPNSGEIDIVEHVGRNLDVVFLCLHTESHNHRKGSEYFTEYKEDSLSDGFHTYAIVWDETSITYLIDDIQRAKYVKGENGFDPTEKGWPFDQNFYLILNLAIGGTFGGEVDSSVFPQKFIIQDIKIFQ